jgi:hypothetical protein
MPFVNQLITSGKHVEWADAGVTKSGKVMRSLLRVKPDDGTPEVVIESRTATLIPAPIGEPAAGRRKTKRRKTHKRKRLY